MIIKISTKNFQPPAIEFPDEGEHYYTDGQGIIFVKPGEVVVREIENG